jgi:hypothetical protein
MRRKNSPFNSSFNSSLKVDFPRFTGDFGWWLGLVQEFDERLGFEAD